MTITIVDRVIALMRAAGAIGEVITAEMIVSTVQADMIVNQSRRSSEAGKLGAAVRAEKRGKEKASQAPLQGATSTLAAPLQGANASPLIINPDLFSESDSGIYSSEVEPIPVVGKDGPTWRVPTALLAELGLAYPHADVAAEVRKCRLHYVTNASNRKTAKGMPRAIANWFSNASKWGTLVKKSEAARQGAALSPPKKLLVATPDLFGTKETGNGSP